MSRSGVIRYTIQQRWFQAAFATLSVVALVFGALSFPKPIRAASSLSVEIIAAPNLVVDSNVLSPSSFAPEVATVIGKVCNTASGPGAAPLNGVKASIGNYAGSGAGTPGIYPARGPADGSPFTTVYPHLSPPYSPADQVYSFTHLGGSRGLADATREIGTLEPGQCQVQYWHFKYPRRSNLSLSNDNLGSQPIWGVTHDPLDDLWLEFDIWATGLDGAAAVAEAATHKMTMRNEISAMANKIRPNPDGIWFNTNADIVLPGETITSNGINYELGVINQGFDNDGDFQPDFNVWLQPVGDDSYDPSCFRLIESHGTITVTRSGGNPPYIENFQDKLYFTNLPSDNTGGQGTVYYTFLALSGPCSSALSPYQEVASGSDNEKFSADYGAGIPPVGSAKIQVSIDKSSQPTLAPLNSLVTYSIPFANNGTASAGLPMAVYGDTFVRLPLQIQDHIPAGTIYHTGSAAYAFDEGSPGTITIFYSTDSGASWSSLEPASGVTDLRWVFDEKLPAGASGILTFSVDVPLSYASPTIENEACGSFGDTIAFDCGSTTTLVEGSGTIGDWVWQDADSDAIQDAGEIGLNNVPVSLYFDKNNDGSLDEQDILLGTQLTASGGSPAKDGWYAFTRLPYGSYLIMVDGSAAAVPTGLSPTTQTTLPVTLTMAAPSTTSADFGFGPVLVLSKALTSSDPVLEGALATFSLNLVNTRPGDGSGTGACTYTTYATIDHPSSASPNPDGGGNLNAQWGNTPLALYSPDNLFATTNLDNNANVLGLSGFYKGPQTGAIQKVEWVLYLKQLAGMSTETLTAQTYYQDAATASNHAITGWSSIFTAGNSALVRVDITNDKGTPWQWSDFGSFAGESMLELQLTASRGNGDLGLDAAALVITTSATSCGGPDYDIVTLPLVDTYDADVLEFVSASIPPSSVTVSGTPPDQVGTLTWTNLGPLFPGQIKPLTVTFRALDQQVNPVTTTNTASVAGARFGNGRAVNDASDQASLSISGLGSLTGRVWSESASGSVTGWSGTTGYEPQDGGIPNVTVNLYACRVAGSLYTGGTSNKTCAFYGGTWDLVAARETAADGSYAFTGLNTAGYYFIEVAPSSLPGAPTHTAERVQNNASGYTCGTCFNQWHPSGGDARTANLDAAFQRLAATPNNRVDNINFGYSFGANRAVLYGYVYSDYAHDGSFTPGDDGVNAVTVYLCTSTPCTSSSALQTVVTTNGLYEFPNLPVGTGYYVGVNTAPGSPVSGWANTDDPGAGALDSQSDAILLSTAGMVSGPHNFGYAPLGSLSIGDKLYLDWNNNGFYDSGETGIANVTLYLYEDSNSDGLVDAGDALVASTTTGVDGNYAFASLPAGSYIVAVDESDPDLPAGAFQTGDPDENSGVCTTCDGKGRAILTTSSLVTLDFGYRILGSAVVGDQVFQDLDGDGVADPAETGISAIGLSLYFDHDNDGILDPGLDPLVASTETDGYGAYAFTNLPAGNYLVQVDSSDPQLPSGYTLSSISPHDVAGTSTLTAAGLSTGESYLEADFGFAPAGQIGDRVWQDNNRDGFQDYGEPGLPGVTLRLYTYTDANANGQYDLGEGLSSPLASATTSASGTYTFTNVPASSYYLVQVDPLSLPAGYVQTYDPDAPVSAIGCEVVSACNPYASLSLAAAQVDRSIDFAFRPVNAIGDRLWIDVDADGVQDASEPGVANAVVELWSCGAGACNDGDETMVLSTVSDGDGAYSFGGLPAGAYEVRVSPPAGVQPSSDPDGMLDQWTAVTVALATVNLDLDFGYRYQLFGGSNSVSGTLFYDANDNAFQDTSETLTYAGKAVYLWNSSRRLVSTTTTDASGYYTFSGLPDALYYVSVNLVDPDLYALSATVTGSPVTFYSVDLDAAGASVSPVDLLDRDFGFLSQMDLGDLYSPFNNTSLEDDGARHLIGDLYLGSSIDADPDGREWDPAAGLDASDNGVVRQIGQMWTPGSLVNLHVTVTGGSGYLVGWFNWNGYSGNSSTGEYDFDDPNEMVIFGDVTEGENTLQVQVPDDGSYLTGSTLDIRFRLYASDPGTPSLTGLATSGEVEDVHWLFNPTAVVLHSLQVRSSGWAPWFVAGMAFCVLALLLVRRRRA